MELEKIAAEEKAAVLDHIKVMLLLYAFCLIYADIYWPCVHWTAGGFEATFILERAIPRTTQRFRYVVVARIRGSWFHCLWCAVMLINSLPSILPHLHEEVSAGRYIFIYTLGRPPAGYYILFVV